MECVFYKRGQLPPQIQRHIDTVAAVGNECVSAYVCRGRKCPCGSTAHTVTILVLYPARTQVITGNIAVSAIRGTLTPAAPATVLEYIEERDRDQCGVMPNWPAWYHPGDQAYFVGRAGGCVGSEPMHAVADFTIFANSAAMTRRQRKLAAPSHRHRHVMWVEIDATLECVDITGCVPVGSRSPWSRPSDDTEFTPAHGWRDKPHMFVERAVVLVEKRTRTRTRACTRVRTCTRTRARARRRATIAAWSPGWRDVTTWNLRADCVLGQYGFTYNDKNGYHISARYDG